MGMSPHVLQGQISPAVCLTAFISGLCSFFFQPGDRTEAKKIGTVVG